MKQKPLSEKQITQQIRYILKLHGILHWKQWQGAMSTPGIPDILGVQPKTGRMIAIEIKSSRGKISPAQENVMRLLKEAGAIVLVARSVDDVMVNLNLLKGE